MLDVDSIYMLDENIVLRSINDKFWALDTRLGTQYRLNRVSYDVLSLMNGISTVDEIIRITSKKYDVSETIFYSDTKELLNLALLKGVITGGEH